MEGLQESVKVLSFNAAISSFVSDSRSFRRPIDRCGVRAWKTRKETHTVSSLRFWLISSDDSDDAQLPTLVITKWEDTKSFGITRSHGAEVHFGFLENCQISMVSLTGFNSVILRVIRSPKNWNCLGYLDDPHFVGKYQQVTFADWGQQFNDTMDMEIGWCSCEPEFAEVDVQMCSKKCNTKLLVQRIFSCENIPKGLYTIII